jgi:DNA-binding transcriptional LysR family regulator
MNLDELEAFVQIARLGGFTQASRKLGRSQPAVSRRIRQLEQSLGVPLFERVGRSVVLSNAGNALLPHAEAALAAVRDAEDAVRDAARASSAPTALKLAIVGTLADSHLVDALRAFEARFGEASVELTTATSREVSARVLDGEAQLGLRYFADADSRLTSTELGTEKLFLIVPARHPMRQRRLRDLRKLEGERWLGFPPERGQPDSFGHQLERVLAGAGVTNPSFTRVDSLTAQKRLVEAGLGIALMPLSSVREEVRIGSLRAIEVQGLQARMPVVAIRRRDGYESELATSFLKLLQSFTPNLRA